MWHCIEGFREKEGKLSRRTPAGDKIQEFLRLAKNGTTSCFPIRPLNSKQIKDAVGASVKKGQEVRDDGFDTL